MSKLSHSHPDFDPPSPCERCETLVFPEEASLRVFEITGEYLCPSCGDEVLAANGQFGVGA